MSHRGRRSAVNVAVALACLFAAASCDTPLETTADGVDRIVLTPTTASIQAGATVTLTALILDADGNAMRERRVVWASENASIAIVSQSGVVTGVAEGTVQIAASSGGKSASTAITVTPRPVSLVRITPGNATIPVAGSISLQVEALDASGAPVVGRQAAWTSSNETIAVVSANGVVAGIAVGSVTITATIDGQSGIASITVAPQPVASVVITPAGATTIVGRRVTLRAVPLDAADRPLTGRTTVWTSSNPAVAAVSSSGEVLGLAVGTAQIRATIEGKFAEATIVVDPVPVARVVATPTQVTLNPGQTSQLTITLTDSTGNVLNGRNITYTSSNAQVATVSATGLVTAVAEGSAQIQAASEGISTTVLVTVNPVPVASIRITPSVLSIGIGQTSRLVAQALDAQGNALQNRRFTWISGAPAVASVNQIGEVTGVAGGSAAVFAAVDGVSASATVTVSASVATVVVAPANPTLSVGQTLGMIAILSDINGTILTGRVVQWASGNPSVATINASGLVSAVSSGTATISATSEGKTGSTVVTVSVIPVARVEVAPNTVSLNPGNTSQLTATAYDANNNVLQRSVSWASSNQGAATVSATGLVTAVATGSATITATAGGVSGTAVITVANVPVASVTVTPGTPNMFPGDVRNLTATARDASGNLITGRPTTWASSNSSVATVNSSGAVTAITVGAATITATVDGVSGSATVTVNQTPVASVTLSPTSASLFQGQARQFQATALDASGNPLSRPITWTTTNPNVVIINVTQGGVATAINPGTEGVVATVVGGGVGGVNVADTSTVTVSLVPVASVAISPSSVTMFVTQQQPLTVQLFDSVGGTLSASGRTITWGSANSSIASVNSSGLVTANAQGTTRIRVSTPGVGGTVTDSVNVTVNTAPIASVSVVPASDAVNQGATKSLRAVVVDGLGVTVRGRNVNWQSGNTTVATVSQVSGTPDSATYTGVAPGSTFIVALDPSGLRDTAFVTVNAPVHTVTVTSGRNFIVPGDTMQLTVVLRDAQNNVLTGRTITYTSSDNNIATAANSVVTGGPNAGSVTITVTSEGISATLGLSGIQGIASMAVTGPANSVATDTLLPQSTSKTYTVTVTDGAGVPVNGKVLTVTNSSPGIVDVPITTVITNGSGQATVDATGTTAGSSTITFTAPARTGTVPPGTAGSNTPSRSIRITVP